MSQPSRWRVWDIFNSIQAPSLSHVQEANRWVNKHFQMCGKGSLVLCRGEIMMTVDQLGSITKLWFISSVGWQKCCCFYLPINDSKGLIGADVR